MNTVPCPHCGKSVEVSSLLETQMRQKILAESREDHKKQLEVAKREVADQLQQKLSEEFALKVKLASENENAAKERLKSLESQILELTKQLRTIMFEKDQLKVEMEKRLLLEQEAIRKRAIDETLERTKLEVKEKEKTIDDLKKALDEAQRKATIGSQQLQGEIQELDLETTLRAGFPDDTIEPVGKGIMGADIRQVVKSAKGTICGTILWESKRTKNWTDSWLPKLKEDLRNDKAHIAVLVSETLPSDISTEILNRDGVWICSPSFSLILAQLLREALIREARQRYINDQRSTRAEDLYAYVTGHEFSQQIERMIETFLDMKTQLEKERVAYEKFWKQREMQITKLLSGTSGIYGSMHGIAGSALPSIPSLTLQEE